MLSPTILGLGTEPVTFDIGKETFRRKDDEEFRPRVIGLDGRVPSLPTPDSEAVHQLTLERTKSEANAELPIAAPDADSSGGQSLDGEPSAIDEAVGEEHQGHALQEHDQQYEASGVEVTEPGVSSDNTFEAFDATDVAGTGVERTREERLGQDRFRAALLHVDEGRCAVTGISDPEVLVASHILPWAQSSDRQRLDVCNGLLLVADLDRAFDKGLISFDEDGRLLISESVSDELRARFKDYRSLSARWITEPRRREFLRWHRENVFR